MSCERVESIGGAEASVSVAIVDEIVGVGAVDGSSLGLDDGGLGSDRRVLAIPSSAMSHLPIRTVWASDIRACQPKTLY